MPTAPLPRCIGCGRPGRPLGWSARWTLHRCPDCGLVYPANWGDQLGAGDFHEGNEAYYRSLPRAAPSELTTRRISELLFELERHVPERSLLDVGCGRGEIVEVASGLGWTARGIDLAQAAIELCRERSLPCTRTDFFSEVLSAECFGLVVMSEFIEHVPDGARFLSRAFELLRPGGILYVTTPNFDSLGRRVFKDDWDGFCEGHVALYTPSGVRHLARQVGFQPLRVESANLSPSAVMRLLRRGRRAELPSVPASGGGGQVAPSRKDQQAAMQVLRQKVYGSKLLSRAKRVADAGVRLTGLGETVRAVLQKP